jgi:hypothetical protein
MRSLVVVLSAAALIVASSQPIRADPVRVDQVSALSASSAGPASSSHSAAQAPAFLVGISGQLVSLEVFLNRLATVGPPDGRPGGNTASGGDVSRTLASHSISPFATQPSTSRAPVQFDIGSAQLQVIAGRLLAFVEGNRALVDLGLSPPAVVHNAPSGSGSYLPPGAPAGAGLGGVVFAQPDPVPEPTTIALVGSGLLLGAMGRRRRRQRKDAVEP